MAKYHRTFVNEEPTWSEKHSQSDIIRAFNWYETNKNEKDAGEYLNVDATIARSFRVLAWAKRMMSRGCVFSEASAQTIADMDSSLTGQLNRIKEEKRIAAQAVEVNIQERVSNRTNVIIGELEGMVDDYGFSGKAESMNVYQWMQKWEVKPIHAPKIANHFKKRAKEIEIAMIGKDEDLKEAYSVYKKSQIRNLLACIMNIISDAEKLSSNGKATRKPRKRKAVSFEKKVAKLNYKSSCQETKIASISPVRILGASQLWVYNTKTRKLGVYVAADAAGLHVKGSTLENYKYSESVSKTVRKPDTILPKVIAAGKVALRKILGEINAKAQEMNGRINKDTILLRVE